MADVALERVLMGDTIVVATWRRFVALVFDGETTVKAIGELQRASDAWLERHPGKTVDLAVVHPSSTHMSQEARSAFASLVKDHQDNRVAGATVILAEGLRGALHRSVITAINLLAPPPHPAKVHGSVGESLSWLEPYIVERCGEAPLAELEAEIEKLHSELR